MTALAWGLVFSGHMIDRLDRLQPRFPVAAVPAVADAVAAGVAAEIDRREQLAPVLAGGACGGDILFHEACRQQGLATEVVLALPPEQFRRTSVAFAGADWERRYDELLSGGLVQVLDAETPDAPFDYANRWMLDAASSGTQGFTLLVLWDGAGGDDEGGTADMVRRARAAGGEVRRIDPATLEGPSR
ncbi:MAG: hypothetical protein OES57_09310 [Acidimicrobiia bacterium]|nr:hypothetical protein [Acidimicrobiia bacterium]